MEDLTDFHKTSTMPADWLENLGLMFEDATILLRKVHLPSIQCFLDPLMVALINTMDKHVLPKTEEEGPVDTLFTNKVLKMLNQASICLPLNGNIPKWQCTLSDVMRRDSLAENKHQVGRYAEVGLER